MVMNLSAALLATLIVIYQLVITEFQIKPPWPETIMPSGITPKQPELPTNFQPPEEQLLNYDFTSTSIELSLETFFITDVPEFFILQTDNSPEQNLKNP
jgi:hypothetical protein